jgi:hypothetical protein
MHCTLFATASIWMMIIPCRLAETQRMRLYILARTLLFSPAVAAAATFAPSEFKNGDAWTYQIEMVLSAQPETSFRQEYSVLWKAQNGNFSVGERRAESGRVWSIGRQFAPDRCLVFIPDLTFELGNQFCTTDVQPNTEFDQELPQGKRTVAFKGFVSTTSPHGYYKAAHFVIVDQFGDSTAPSATRRVWNFWFVPELRAFTRMKLRYEDASGTAVRTVTLTLLATTVRP